MTTLTAGAMLAGPTAFAASGHGGHSGGGGGGARASTGNSSRGGRTIASVVPARPTTPVQRTIIQTCPVRPIGSLAACPPGQRTPGWRCYCHAHGVYFFGQYSYFDDYWFGQYPYARDSYAAAYQPQIAPNSYYEQMGWQWGKDLKDRTVPQERLVALIQVQMLNAPQHSQKAFRRGFLTGYGAGGETVLAQIIKQAKESNAPKPLQHPAADGQKQDAPR